MTDQSNLFWKNLFLWTNKKMKSYSNWNFNVQYNGFYFESTNFFRPIKKILTKHQVQTKMEKSQPTKKKFDSFLLTNILCSIRTKTLLTIFLVFLIFYAIIVGIIVGIFSQTYFQYEGKKTKTIDMKISKWNVRSSFIHN